jgi:hypothetical protein
VPILGNTEIFAADHGPQIPDCWDSVGSATTRTGTAEKRPQSDEDWKALRREAVVLTETTNLLIPPGRAVTAGLDSKVTLVNPGRRGSLGGMTAQATALRHPERLNVLVVSNSLASISGAGIEAWEGRKKDARQYGMESQVRSTLERWFTPRRRLKHLELCNGSRP